MRTRKNTLNEQEMELVKYLMSDCRTTGDIQEKLKRLFAGNNSGNSRNGYGEKTIISDYGECKIAVPRDRNGEFEPRVLAKRQTRTDEIERKILAMYAKGMSHRKYQNIPKSWDKNWAELTSFFENLYQ